MRITRVSLHEVVNTLVNPFRASSHAAGTLHHILVRLEDADGGVGWGESATPVDPYYLGETTETAWHILRDFLVPSVVGRSWQTIEEFVALYALVKGNSFARSGIEMAAWDLLARHQGRSVADLLGGTRDEIHSGVSLGIERDDGRLLDLIGGYLAEGYRRVKLKIAPGHDTDVLERVRAAFPDAPLMVDGNAAYTLDDVDHLKKLDAFDLMMIRAAARLLRSPWTTPSSSACSPPRSAWTRACARRATPATRFAWAAAGWSTSRWPAWAACSRPGASTTCAMRTEFRCGAEACTTSGLGGRPTSRSPACPGSASRATSRGSTSTSRRTWSSRPSSRGTARWPCRATDRASGTTWCRSGLSAWTIRSHEASAS